jgi:hypothetical protein
MGRTALTGFWTISGNLPNWHHMYNANIDIFNQQRLLLLGLQDVDIKALQDGSILQYNSTSAKWEVIFNRRT